MLFSSKSKLESMQALQKNQVICLLLLPLIEGWGFELWFIVLSVLIIRLVVEEETDCFALCVLSYNYVCVLFLLWYLFILVP